MPEPKLLGSEEFRQAALDAKTAMKSRWSKFVCADRSIPK
jgi:hypothetical protein